MKTFLYGLTTLFLGFFIHIFLQRYLSIQGYGPNLLLLLVVAHGFILGPIFGETIGFIWGLMADVMGVNLFGLFSLLYSIAGYASGQLSKRVASERPTTQLVIALGASVYLFLGTAVVKSLLQFSGVSRTLWSMAVVCFYNVFLITVVFLLTEKWISLWQLDREFD